MLFRSNDTAPNTLSNYGVQVQRPNVADLKSAAIDNPTPDRWFNTAAFTAPSTYAMGNAPRWIPNIRFGPTNHADLAILKNFRFMEHIKAQFRAEMFNAFNHTNFGTPTADINSAAFGTIRSTFVARQVQFALKLSF